MRLLGIFKTSHIVSVHIAQNYVTFLVFSSGFIWLLLDQGFQLWFEEKNNLEETWHIFITQCTGTVFPDIVSFGKWFDIVYRAMFVDNVQHECYPGEWACPSSGVCILMEQLCDSTPHCPDGEDETNSTAGRNCSQ